MGEDLGSKSAGKRSFREGSTKGEKIKPTDAKKKETGRAEKFSLEFR